MDDESIVSFREYGKYGLLPDNRHVAKAMGLKMYWGRMCKKGHDCPNRLQGRCVECTAEDNSARYRRDREKIIARTSEWITKFKAKDPEKYAEVQKDRARKRRANDPEKYRDIQRSYAGRNKEKRKAQARERYAANKAHFQEKTRIWRKNNPEKVSEGHKKWVANNPEKAAAAYRAKRARKKNAAGSHTIEDIASIRDMQKDKCAICCTKLKGMGQIDHIMPLAKGGSDSRSNLQLLCSSCNAKKWAHDPIDYMQSLGRLL